MGKHCNNSQCFKEKKTYKAKFLISLILKKIKSTEIILGILQKNIKKKNHVGNTVTIHSVL
jgi:hypothetical protein